MARLDSATHAEVLGQIENIDVILATNLQRIVGQYILYDKVVIAARANRVNSIENALLLIIDRDNDEGARMPQESLFRRIHLQKNHPPSKGPQDQNLVSG